MKRFSKIITLVLALAVIIGAVAVLSTANEGTPTLEYANVVYGDQLSLVFTVDNLAEGETAGIAVYESADAADDAFAYRTFEAQEADGVVFYETMGIAAKDIGRTYYIAAVSKDADGNVTVGEKTAYSVVDYLNARLAAENVSEEQAAVYDAILDYGAAAAAVLKSR